MNWDRAGIAADGTHHVIDGVPAYSARFLRVQKFHHPGLAPALDATGAFHITPDGLPAYANRFRESWGFYEGFAAVQDVHGWHHIAPNGVPLSDTRYAWCGNFQEGRCTVRTGDGEYHHITDRGQPAYAARYLYAGDFRDGAAVVRCPARGLCTHITTDGGMLHDRWFEDLDVFHKGFARARDAEGWFHIDILGQPLGSARYGEVEPFYNGQARVLTHEGAYCVIDQAGQVTARVGRLSSTPAPACQKPHLA